MNATVTDIQRFCMHDGPGIRTVVFLKGCPLRCLWCHNPETQAFTSELFYTDSLCAHCGQCVSACPRNVHSISAAEHTIDRSLCKKCGICAKLCQVGALEISGRKLELDEIIDIVARDIPFYGTKGGLTLSGGEPLAQPEAARELLCRTHDLGISTAIETSGAFLPKYADIAASCDTILFDIKDTSADRLKTNTGAELSQITANLRLIDEKTNGVIRLRCIMIPNVNMNDEHYTALAALQSQLKHCEGIELLPYHSLGLSKSARLGRTDQKFVEPTSEQLCSAADMIRARGGTIIERRSTKA